jgi:hypothetical protein
LGEIELLSFVVLRVLNYDFCFVGGGGDDSSLVSLF